jgi:hypothetical protein
MAYFIFFKSLRSLGEFWKNPHVKIPPKSPSANFQSLGIFKNQILFRKEFPPSLSAHPAFRPSLFFLPANFPSPSHWASALRPAQPTRTAQPATFLLPPAPKPSAHGASTGREKRPHLISLHFPPLIGAVEFLRTHPSTFSQAKDTMDAED